MLLIEKICQQHQYNRKIQNWVVKLDGEEIGVIEKQPNYPFSGRLIDAIKPLGEFKNAHAAAKAIFFAWKDEGNKTWAESMPEILAANPLVG